MRTMLLFISIVALFSCQSAEEKQAEEAPEETVVLNPAISEIVTFMADSVADCQTWLSTDYRVRTFFEPSDTLADFLTQRFNHNEILAFFESIEKTTQLDLSAYLNQADINYVSEVDSLIDCGTAINAVAFLNPNKAVVLYTNITKTAEFSQTFLLQKRAAGWQITDTLREEILPRTR